MKTYLKKIIIGGILVILTFGGVWIYNYFKNKKGA